MIVHDHLSILRYQVGGALVMSTLVKAVRAQTISVRQRCELRSREILWQEYEIIISDVPGVLHCWIGGLRHVDEIITNFQVDLVTRRAEVTSASRTQNFE